MTPLSYTLEDFGTAVDLDKREYDEYRIHFEDKGSLRLSAQGGRWAHPTYQIVHRLATYLQKGGGKHIIRRAELRLDGACYARFSVLDYETHIGPLDAQTPRVFIFDRDGGCIGHFPLEDLPDVRDILHDLWTITPGPDLFVDLYLNHAHEALKKEQQ